MEVIMSNNEELVENCINEIEGNYKTKEDTYKIKSGIGELDNILQGFKSGDLNIIASRPGIGKTTFALHVFSNMANSGNNCLYISFEKDESELIKILLSINSHVDTTKMNNGFLKVSDFKELTEAAGNLYKSKSIFLKSFYNTNFIILKEFIKKMIDEYKIEIVFIDYLTLIIPAPTYANRWEQVSEISRSLKTMAMEYKIPLIVLCPVNRNAVENTPKISDLSESGSIEYDADRIILLYEDEKDKSEQFELKQHNQRKISICVAKNKRGPQGKFNLFFDYANKIYASIEVK
jgi:replicative DNA helicase